MILNAHEAEEAKAFVEKMGFLFRFYLEIEPRQDGNQEPLKYRLDAQTQIEMLRKLRPEALEKTPFKEKQNNLEVV